MVRKEPKTFGEFLTRAQKYINVDDYFQPARIIKAKWNRKSEIEIEMEETKKPKNQYQVYARCHITRYKKMR